MTALTQKNQTSRVLRVLFTDAQRLELGKQLAEEHGVVAQTNADFDGIKASFKAKLTASEAKIVDLSNKVSNGYEMKPVPCQWQMDYPRPGVKTLFRLDGPEGAKGEIVEVIAMTEAEKTPELALNLDNPVLAAGTGIATDGSVTLPADGPAQPGDGKK